MRISYRIRTLCSIAQIEQMFYDGFSGLDFCNITIEHFQHRAKATGVGLSLLPFGANQGNIMMHVQGSETNTDDGGCAIYIRQATANVSRFNVSEQLCSQIAHDAGWIIVGIFADLSFSGNTPLISRPSLLKIFQMADQGSIDRLIVPTIDHLSRSADITQSMIGKLGLANVQLICAAENRAIDPDQFSPTEIIWPILKFKRRKQSKR
jgi:Resolvase, N terminal domain